MQTLNFTHNRLGAFVLGISGLLFAVFPLVRPFFPTPDMESPTSLTVVTQVFSSTLWVIAHFIVMLAFVLLLFGMLTLYNYLTNSSVERGALLAMILSLAGIALIMPTLGVETYTLPVIGKMYLEGKTEVVSAVELIYSGPDTLVLILGLLLLASGAIVFAIAIWQSGILPQWAGVIFAIGFTLWFPLFPQMIRIIDGLLIGIGGVWLAWSIWQKLYAGAIGTRTMLQESR
jgi:hypothetical protein